MPLPYPVAFATPALYVPMENLCVGAVALLGMRCSRLV
jgi:hypothetical protein